MSGLGTFFHNGEVTSGEFRNSQFVVKLGLIWRKDVWPLLWEHSPKEITERWLRKDNTEIFLQDFADGDHEVMKSELEESDVYRSHWK